MKIWRFYKKPSKEVKKSKIDMYLKYPILAITNSKKLAKKYMISRNMNNILYNVDDVDDEEGLRYMRKNRGNILEYKSIKTYKNKNTVSEIKILITENEENHLYEILDTGFLGVVMPANINPKIFNKKIFNLLYNLEYVTLYALLNEDTSFFENDYPYVDWEYDPLAAFLVIYSDVLNQEGFLSIIKY